MMKNILPLLLALALSACLVPLASPPGTKNTPQDVSAPPVSHTVIAGDTLYAIAWRYDFDYRQLAHKNNIPPPYLIYPGQHIRLDAESPMVTKQETATQTAAPSAAALQKPATTTSPPISTISDAKLRKQRWQWPAQGHLLALFQPRLPGRQGILIAGQEKQRIHAAAGGEVVYNGKGLPAYGRLLIIKHSDDYLSAYAHNSHVLVNEGDHVKQGQAISEMGYNRQQQVALYFEIRYRGKPVDPIGLLPPKEPQR